MLCYFFKLFIFCWWIKILPLYQCQTPKYSQFYNTSIGMYPEYFKWYTWTWHFVYLNIQVIDIHATCLYYIEPDFVWVIRKYTRNRGRVLTARRVCTMHSCRSVCHTPVFCLNGYTYPQPHHSSIPVPNGVAIFRRRLPYNGGVKCKGVWKNHDYVLSVYLENDAR